MYRVNLRLNTKNITITLLCENIIFTHSIHLGEYTSQEGVELIVGVLAMGGPGGQKTGLGVHCHGGAGGEGHEGEQE